MWRRARHTVGDARGQDLVEFAVVLLLLGLLLGGIYDLGRAFLAYINIANAAREGARLGARLPCWGTDPDQPTQLSQAIRDAVLDEALRSGVNLTAMGCDITDRIELLPDPQREGCARWQERQGWPLQVTVSCEYQPQMMRVTGLGSFTLTARASMAIHGNETSSPP